MWQCSVCGYIHDGTEAPEQCPKCGAPREKFVEITTEAANLVQRARLTNQLLVSLMSMVEGLGSLADKGIKDNLDPGCMKIFSYTKRVAAEIRQMAKAEIQIHVQKGKWG
ncbi:rubredoxin-like domain-containing protein [Calderihabitans maritimus]|uniref:Rubredoxin-type Fe(Cys)4 protein n=1 Tax=Calderihabitans maritimus TaxID=1246530 RepID=A0A1Z5HPG0_9FIRM|nr:rubredoxin [Calderihabitans maritimus]GAW91328.1 rubredoxin-type Fe(Cys)4 protein [Calderihabitans maritimus]